MTKRQLDRSGIAISPMVLGGNVFGWTADKARSHDVLDRFTGAGLEAIDTADVYSRWGPGNQGGESETIIGEWIASRKARDPIVLIAKVGYEMNRGGLSATTLREGKDPKSAPPPQLVGIWRKGPAQHFGFLCAHVHEGGQRFHECGHC